MPTVTECVCCCDIKQVEDVKNQLSDPVLCITLRPGFYNVYLDIWVLQTAYNVYHQQYGTYGTLNFDTCTCLSVTSDPTSNP